MILRKLVDDEIKPEIFKSIWEKVNYATKEENKKIENDIKDNSIQIKTLNEQY